jgi:DNA-binding LytR/AlgR family response regulator
MLAFSFSVFLLSLALFDHSYSFLRTINYTLGEDLAKYIVVYGSFALFYLYQYKVPETAAILPVSTITVTSGNKTKVIDVCEIISITASSPYVIIQTGNGRYVYQQTLKIMLAKLANQRFLQIHKSHLINLDQVNSYKSRLNGDYDVVMKNGAELRLSRTFVGPFKQALR